MKEEPREDSRRGGGIRKFSMEEEEWDAINPMIAFFHNKLRNAEETRKAWLRTLLRKER